MMSSMSVGYCQCGCGELAPIAPKTDKRFGWVKGQPKQFIHNHHLYRTDPLYIEEDRGYATPCWAWQRALNTQGHAQITVDGKAYLAHKYFYEKRYGPVQPGMHLHHRCEQRDCTNIEHLTPLSPAEHARIRKTTKLTCEDVLEMRRLYAEGNISYSQLGKFFGVSTMSAHYSVNKAKVKGG